MIDVQDPVRPGDRPRPKDGLISQPIGEECLVYDADTDALHLLDPIANRVWSGLDGRTTLAALAARLSDQFAADRAHVLADMLGLVADLTSKGLLVQEIDGRG